MRILLLNDDVLPQARGGVAVMVQHLRSGLAARGHEVTLLTTHQEAERGERVEWRDESGTVVSLFVAQPGPRRHKLCVRNPALSDRLRRQIIDMSADVVHAHNLHMFLTYESLAFARSLTPRVYLTAHDTFLVSYGRVGGVRYEQAVARRYPYRLHWWENVQTAGRKYVPLRNYRIRHILRSTGTRTVAISKALEGFLQHNGIPNMTVIHNGVPACADPDPAAIAAFRRRWGMIGPTVLFGGRISEDKGAFALATALERVLQVRPDTRLLITADATATDEHLRRMPPSVRHAAIVTGWLPRGDMALAYATADVVTTPSLYLDAFNIMNTEAMAAGKPCVGSIFGGMPEVIDNGVTGFLVNPRDTDTYASALLALLQDSPRARTMGEAGRNRARTRFSLDAYIDAHLALYSATADRRLSE